jgi:hypothetical protein
MQDAQLVGEDELDRLNLHDPLFATYVIRTLLAALGA